MSRLQKDVDRGSVHHMYLQQNDLTPSKSKYSTVSDFESRYCHVNGEGTIEHVR